MSTIIGLVSTFRLPLHPSASTSNPNSFDFFFGLHRAFPPLQRPIQPASVPFQIRNFKNDSYSY